MDEGATSSTSRSSADVGDGGSTEQTAESNIDCNTDKGSSETMLACGDAEVVKGDVAMQTDDEGLADVVEVNRYLNEPMLIRESTDKLLPRSLVKFYDELKASGSFRASAVLLKVLMNELGYLEQDKVCITLSV